MHMCILVLRLLGGVCVRTSHVHNLSQVYLWKLVITVVIITGKINQGCSVGSIFFTALQF